MLRGRKELDQDTEALAQQELKTRAKVECRGLLAYYAACMRVEGFLGPFRCKSDLHKLNECLRQKYEYRCTHLTNCC